MSFPQIVCDSNYDPLPARVISSSGTKTSQFELLLDVLIKDDNPAAFKSTINGGSKRLNFINEYTPPVPSKPGIDLQTGFEVAFNPDEYDLDLGWSDLSPENQPSSVPHAADDDEAAFAVKRFTVDSMRGFDNEAMHWSVESEMFAPDKATQETPFHDYWLQTSVVGTLYKRINLAIADAKEMETNGTYCRRVLSAVISFFSTQVLFIYEEMNELQPEIAFISLYTQAHLLCTKLEEIYTCLDQLKLIINGGSPTQLLNTVYVMSQSASQVCSETTYRLNHAVLLNNMLCPWIQELNFVVGLSSKTCPRLLSNETKQHYFPDVFIGFNEEKTRCILIRSQIPCFVPPWIAHATLECYKLCTILTTAKHPGALMQTNQTAIDWELANEREYPHKNKHIFEPNSFYDFSTQRLPFLSHKKKDIMTSVPTMPELWKRLMVVVHQHQQLENIVKQTVYTELLAFRDVIVDLYFLCDGCLWARMCDYIHAAFSSNPLNAVSALIKLEEVVNAKFPDICFVFKNATNELFIQYEPPPSIIQLFDGIEFITRECQAVFNKVVALHCSKRFMELLNYSFTLQTKAKTIDNALIDPKAGISQVIAAFRNPCD